MTMPGTGELIKSGRAFVAEQWGLIILAAVGAPILLSILSKILEKALEHSALSFGAHIGIFALSLIISLGAKKITLDLVDGKDAQLGDLFSQSQLFWKFLLATVVYAVVLVVGFILLIIPGIYFSLKYGFFGYILVDHPELSAMESLSESARLTEGIRWQLFVFSLALIGINILGAIVFGIGLLYTLPVSIMAYTALYRSLTKIASDTVPAASSVDASAPMVSEGVPLGEVPAAE